MLSCFHVDHVVLMSVWMTYIRVSAFLIDVVDDGVVLRLTNFQPLMPSHLPRTYISKLEVKEWLAFMFLFTLTEKPCKKMRQLT